MRPGAKENFILLVLFLAAALLVVTAAIVIGYFYVRGGRMTLSQAGAAFGFALHAESVQCTLTCAVRRCPLRLLMDL